MTKYRIIVGSSTSYPYRVEKKDKGWFSFWTEIDRSETVEDAEEKMRRYIRAKIPRSGTIVKVYDEQDLLADMLKGSM
jgi:hypothetical protein